MNQGYYTNNPNIFVPQRLIQDKYTKVDTLTSKLKSRESQPPLTQPEKKIYEPKFTKEKELNISNPYIPSSASTSTNANSYKTNEPLANPTMKNYVTPYSQYPQSSVQPRLSKTIPYEEEISKRIPIESPQSSGYNNQLRDFSKPQLQTKRSIPGAETSTKRVPRFSEPAMFNPSLEQNNTGTNKYSYIPPSPIKVSNNNSYDQFNSPLESPSHSTPSNKISSFDINKYATNPMKTNTPNIYAHQSSSTSNSSSYLTPQVNSRMSKIIPQQQTQQQHYNTQTHELRIDDFARGTELGSGKFGKVFIARHKYTGFICAIKEIPKKIIIEENILNQFIRELKIQSCLDHPNIIRLYGFFHDKVNIYLILELGSQGQLYKIIKQKKKLSEATVSFVIRQLCEAVKYLHSLSIIHRDIKPENIVIQQGTVKICDFGWSVCRSGQLRSTFCGTPLYVSPEILKGQLYDQKIDIWALGILTYELLVGDTPFEIYSEQELVKIIKQDITFPSNVNISNDAKDFILKILKKNPNERTKVSKLIEHPFLNKIVEVFQLDI